MKTNIHLLYCIPEKLLELEMFQGNFVEEKKNKYSYFMFKFFLETHAFLEKKWKYFVEPERTQMTIWPMPWHPGYPRLQPHPQHM